MLENTCKRRRGEADERGRGGEKRKEGRKEGETNGGREKEEVGRHDCTPVSRGAQGLS